MTARAFQLRGWHVLALLFAMFGTIIAVNVAFAVVAVRSFPGEDVRRSYLQGLRYNQILEDRRTQAALGWRASAGLFGDMDAVSVEVRLRRRDGAPIDNATLTGELQWPTASSLDRELSFTFVGDGRYVARVGNLPSGRWRLRGRAEDGAGGALDLESELTWRRLR